MRTKTEEFNFSEYPFQSYDKSVIVPLRFTASGTKNFPRVGAKLYFQQIDTGQLQGKQITAIRCLTPDDSVKMLLDGQPITVSATAYKGLYLTMCKGKEGEKPLQFFPAAALSHDVTEDYLKQFSQVFNWPRSFAVVSDTTGMTVGTAVFFEVFFNEVSEARAKIKQPAKGKIKSCK